MGQDDVTSRLVGWFVGLRRGGWLRVALRPRDGVVFRMDEGKGRQLVSGVLYSPSHVEVGIAISFAALPALGHNWLCNPTTYTRTPVERTVDIVVFAFGAAGVAFVDERHEYDEGVSFNKDCSNNNFLDLYNSLVSCTKVDNCPLTQVVQRTARDNGPRWRFSRRDVLVDGAEQSSSFFSFVLRELKSFLLTFRSFTNVQFAAPLAFQMRISKRKRT